MRRLPVYLVLDVSSSMQGEAIESVRTGVDMLVQALKGEPQALETVYISIITFSSSASQIIPLTDLLSFQPPSIKANGSTALGAALELLSNKIDKEVEKTTKDKRGDWKPMVFLLTDGYPTDSWQKGVDMLRKKKVSVLVACLAGAGDTNEAINVLKEVVRDQDIEKKEGYVRKVVKLRDSNAKSFQAFFQWVTGSIVKSSQSLDTGDSGGILPPPPQEFDIKY